MRDQPVSVAVRLLYHLFQLRLVDAVAQIGHYFLQGLEGDDSGLVLVKEEKYLLHVLSSVFG
jgi:hypothetical protein